MLVVSQHPEPVEPVEGLSMHYTPYLLVQLVSWDFCHEGY